MRRLLPLLALPFLLNGCIPALIAGGAEVGVTAAENRPVGRKVDDTKLYTAITQRFIDEDQASLITDVTFNIRYGRVMLTGITPSESDAQKAVALVWKVKGVKEVINELIITRDSGFFSTANDSLIKRNLEARLLITKGVWVINYSMDVQNGTAYLIGRVTTQQELTRVLNIAKTTKGVKRVVSHLQINPDVDTDANTGTGNSNNSYNSNSYNSGSSYSAPVDNSTNYSAPVTPIQSGPVSQDSTRPAGYSNATSGTVSAPDAISSSPVSPASGGY